MRDSHRQKVLAGWLLAVVIAAAGFYWLRDNFELQDREVRRGYSAEARRNPFLAAGYFLQQTGYTVTMSSERSILRELPPVDDTLVVSGVGAMLSSERLSAINAWLQAGGHLITTASRVWDEDRGRSGDSLLDQIDVRLIIDTDRHDLDRDHEGDRLTEIPFEDMADPLLVSFQPHRHLQDASEAASAAIVSAAGFHLLQYEVGDGLLTVTSDDQLIRNQRFADHDHAYFLTTLIGPADSGAVWLLYDASVPPMLVSIWRHLPQLVVATVILLLLFVWRLLVRFGPPVPDPESKRRDIREHFFAIGRYYWRIGGAQRLTATTREQMLNRWRRRYPALAGLDERETAEWVAAKINREAADVQSALFGDAAAGGDFVDQTRAIQRLMRHSHFQDKLRTSNAGPGSI